MIFIDGSNLYHSLKQLKIPKINFEKLINKLKRDRELVSVFYYNAPLDISINAKKYWDQQKFFNKLRKILKFNLIPCKLVKRKIEKTGEFY